MSGERNIFDESNCRLTVRGNGKNSKKQEVTNAEPIISHKARRNGKSETSRWMLPDISDDISERKYLTSSPYGNENSLALCDVTTVSSVPMDESFCSGTEKLSTLSDDNPTDLIVEQESFGSNDGGNTSDELETTYILQRLIQKYCRGHRYVSDLSNNSKCMLLLLENILEESDNTIRELESQLENKTEEIKEIDKSGRKRLNDLITEHRQRVAMIVKDHEGHLSASIERAVNARRQTAGLQTQLALVSSKLKSSEKKHQEECAQLRFDSNMKVDALKEELQLMKIKLEAKADLESVTSSNKKESLTSSRMMEPSSEALNASEKDNNIHVSEASSNGSRAAFSVRQEIVKREHEIVDLKRILAERTEELERLQKTLDRVNSDILNKAEEVRCNSEKVTMLCSALGSLDGQIEALTNQAARREENLAVLQRKLEDREKLFRSLSKKNKEEKRRSSDLSFSVQMTKEQEQVSLEKLKSLEREKDAIDNRCTIRRNQVETLLEILCSREKMILHLQKELKSTDSELAKLFERTSSDFSPRWTTIPFRDAESVVSSYSLQTVLGGREGHLADSSTDLKNLDMSLDSSIVSTAIYCDAKDTADFRRVEWIRKNRSANYLDMDSGVSSAFGSKNFDVDVSESHSH